MAKSAEKGTARMKTTDFTAHKMSKDSQGRRYEVDKGPAKAKMVAETGPDSKGKLAEESKAITTLFNSAGHPDPLKAYKQGEATESEISTRKK